MNTQETTEKSYGIIFYDYKSNKSRLNLYLRKNLKDYHEDFITKDIDLIEFLKNIPILYKTYNLEKNHTIFLLNKNKYSYIFELQKEYKKISLKKFKSVPFDKTLKHNKLKFNDLNKSLKIIESTYILRNLYN
jgi:hypothetical protein